MKTVHFFFWIVLFLSVACKGPQGDPGPQGAAGPQGPQGPAGPKGSISYYASDWIQSDSQVWIDNYENKTAAISRFGDGLEKITKADLAKGIFLVYDTWREDKSEINALPYDFYEGDLHVWYSFGVAVGQPQNVIILYATFSEDINPEQYFQHESTHYFRWVYIPALSGGRLKGIDTSNYQEVKELLGLED